MKTSSFSLFFPPPVINSLSLGSETSIAPVSSLWGHVPFEIAPAEGVFTPPLVPPSTSVWSPPPLFSPSSARHRIVSAFSGKKDDPETREGSADAYYRRGVIHCELAELDEALEEFEKAIRLDPTLEAARQFRDEVIDDIVENVLLAVDEANEGSEEDACPELMRMTNWCEMGLALVSSERATLPHLLGLIYLAEAWDSDDPERARLSRADFERALTVDPAGFDDPFDLGIAYYRRGQFEKAVEAFSKVESGHPALRDTLELLARGLEVLERLDEAETAAEEGLRRKPEDPTLAALLVRLREKKGKK